MADSADLDDAIVAILVNDATLAGLLPDGVWIGAAKPGAVRYGLILLPATADLAMFTGRAFEEVTYTVLAVVCSTTGSTGKAAAARIDALLQGAQPVVAGFAPAVVQRTRRHRRPDRDADDPSIRWDVRGGDYSLMASTLP